MRKRPRRILWIVAIVAAVFVVLVVGAWLLRNPIASFVATRVMHGQGLSCDPVQVRIPFALPPSLIELAPMHCESSDGPLQSVDFHGPLYVDLNGLGIGLVHTESIIIALRARPHRGVELNRLGDMTKIAGFDEPAVELMFDSAQMSAQKVPPFLASRATVLRAGETITTLRDLRVTAMQEGMSISAARMRVNQAAALGDASLKMTATPDRVAVDVHFHSNLTAKVTAEHMRAPRPKIGFEIGVGESGSGTR